MRILRAWWMDTRCATNSPRSQPRQEPGTYVGPLRPAGSNGLADPHPTHSAADAKARKSKARTYRPFVSLLTIGDSVGPTGFSISPRRSCCNRPTAGPHGLCCATLSRTGRWGFTWLLATQCSCGERNLQRTYDKESVTLSNALRMAAHPGHPSLSRSVTFSWALLATRRQ